MLNLFNVQPLDFAATALRKHFVTVSSTWLESSVEVRTNLSDTLDLRRAAIITPNGGSPHIRIEPAGQNVSPPHEFDVLVPPSGSVAPIACCAGSSCGATFNPPSNPTQCSALMPADVANCFASIPSALTVLAVCGIAYSGQNLRDIASSLPSFDATGPVDTGGFAATVADESIVLHGLTISATGDGGSAGDVRMSVGLDDLHVHLTQATGDFAGSCQPLSIDADFSAATPSGGFSPGAFEVEAPPAAAVDPSGVGGARFGVLTLATPRGRVLVDNINLSLHFPGTNTNQVACLSAFEVFDIDGHVERGILKDLRSFSGNFSPSLSSAADGLRMTYFDPTVAALVADPSAARGVVFLYDPVTDPTRPLRVVHEP